MKKIAMALMVLIVLTMAFALCSCNTDDVIIVYTEAGFAPFEYIKGGKIVGVDVDIMNMVGQKLGKKVVFESVGFDMIIPTVSAGKLCQVGAAGISVTEERRQKVDFSNEYYQANLHVILPKDKVADYQSLTTNGIYGVYWEALQGKNIAVQGGTTADIFLRDELDVGVLANSGATRTAYDKFATALADISLNVDALILDQLPAEQLVANNQDLVTLPLYYKGDSIDQPACDVYAICVTKGQDQLLDAINAVIAELGSEGINALVSKHLGV